MIEYNIEDLIRGAWVRRYKGNLTLDEAIEKYEWLTSSKEYWRDRQDGCRIVKIIEVTETIKQSEW